MCSKQKSILLLQIIPVLIEYSQIIDLFHFDLLLYQHLHENQRCLDQHLMEDF